MDKDLKKRLERRRQEWREPGNRVRSTYPGSGVYRMKRSK